MFPRTMENEPTFQWNGLPEELKCLTGEYMDTKTLASINRANKQSYKLFTDKLFQRSPRKALLWHIKKGNQDAMKKALLNGANIEFWDNRLKLTPLIAAVHSGHLRSIRCILNQGANVNRLKPDPSQSHILSEVASDSAEVVRLLVRRGADVNGDSEKDIWKRGPLHYAARKNRVLVTRELIKQGANLRARDIRNQTPLMLAAEKGMADVLELILDTLSSNGTSAIIEVLEETDISGNTALHLAAYSGSLDAVTALIKRGSNRRAINILGYLPIEFTDKREPEIRKLLMPDNSDPDMFRETIKWLLFDKCAHPWHTGTRYCDIQ